MTQVKSRFKYIGIDPGKGGGIAMICQGAVKVAKCPASVYDMALMFELLIHGSPPNAVIVMIEKSGHGLMTGEHPSLLLLKTMDIGRVSLLRTKSNLIT